MLCACPPPASRVCDLQACQAPSEQQLAGVSEGTHGLPQAHEGVRPKLPGAGEQGCGRNGRRGTCRRARPAEGAVVDWELLETGEGHSKTIWPLFKNQVGRAIEGRYVCMQGYRRGVLGKRQGKAKVGVGKE